MNGHSLEHVPKGEVLYVNQVGSKSEAGCIGKEHRALREAIGQPLCMCPLATSPGETITVH